MIANSTKRSSLYFSNQLKLNASTLYGNFTHLLPFGLFTKTMEYGNADRGNFFRSDIVNAVAMKDIFNYDRFYLFSLFSNMQHGSNVCVEIISLRLKLNVTRLWFAV